MHAVELVRRIRDRQAELLRGKSDEEVVEFFCKAGKAAVRRARGRAGRVTDGSRRPQQRGLLKGGN